MKKHRVSMGIITDAYPKGWGTILVKVQDTSPRVLFPVEAVAGMISENEAQLLKLDPADDGSAGNCTSSGKVGAQNASELCSSDLTRQWRRQ